MCRVRAPICGVCAGLALLFGTVAPSAQAAGAPQLGPAWTAGVTTTTGGLRAEVNPNGLPTTYHFSYLSEAAYQANLAGGKDGFTGASKAPAGADPSLGSGSAAVTASQTISSLSPDTPYRFRVEASNSGGTEVGPSRLFFTEPFAGASILLDGRGWEMVSPAEKGGAIPGFGASFGGGTIQAAAGGESFTFSSPSSFGATQGAPYASQYLARRTASGWLTESITGPTVAGAYGNEPDGVPYQLFSGDLARGLYLGGNRCDVGQPCPRGYALRESASGALAVSAAEPDLKLAGAAPDLNERVISTCAALTADAIEIPGPGGCDPAAPNLYRWSSAGLSLVNLLPAAAQGTPGAELAAQASAISSDGSRVYWRRLAAPELYLREGAVTKQLDDTVSGGGVFETASRDGAVAFFSKAGHLYRYDAASDAVTDLTPGGGLLGVLGASVDGSRVYYLTTAGLFLREGAVTTKAADGADAAEAGSYPPGTGTARVTPDGARLAFVSKASLTGYDNRDATSGTPRSEVFLYDASSATLLCASCNPTGERPIGDSTLPGASANGKAPTATRIYKPRALSDDGRRLFFDSTDALAVQDTAKRPDVYEWEEAGHGSCVRPGGCIALISRGRSSEGGSFLDASVDGDDVFFLTEDSLVGSDTGFADVYDARVGGGFAEAEKPIECVGDACQFLPSEPEDPAPGTLTPSTGNPPLAAEKKLTCKKGFVKKKGKCVRKKKRKSSRKGRNR